MAGMDTPQLFGMRGADGAAACGGDRMALPYRRMPLGASRRRRGNERTATAGGGDGDGMMEQVRSPGVLALAALGGATVRYQNAYRLGYQLAPSCPDDCCNGVAVVHFRELETFGVVPPWYAKTLDSEDWYSGMYDGDVEAGFRAGWETAKMDGRGWASTKAR